MSLMTLIGYIWDNYVELREGLNFLMKYRSFVLRPLSFSWFILQNEKSRWPRIVQYVHWLRECGIHCSVYAAGVRSFFKVFKRILQKHILCFPSDN